MKKTTIKELKKRGNKIRIVVDLPSDYPECKNARNGGDYFFYLDFYPRELKILNATSAEGFAFCEICARFVSRGEIVEDDGIEHCHSCTSQMAYHNKKDFIDLYDDAKTEEKNLHR